MKYCSDKVDVRSKQLWVILNNLRLNPYSHQGRRSLRGRREWEERHQREWPPPLALGQPRVRLMEACEETLPLGASRPSLHLRGQTRIPGWDASVSSPVLCEFPGLTLLWGLYSVQRTRLFVCKMPHPALGNLFSGMESCFSFPIHPVRWPHYFVRNWSLWPAFPWWSAVVLKCVRKQPSLKLDGAGGNHL